MGKILGIASGRSAGGDEHQTVAEGFAELGWEVLRLGEAAAALPPVEIDFALAHPDFGVALVDLMRPHLEPVKRLRDRLDAVGFSEAFPARLPIVHRILGIDDLWRLSLVLDPAFRSQPPMEIAGRAWIGLVQRALLIEAAPLPAPRAAAPTSVEAPLDDPPASAWTETAMPGGGPSPEEDLEGPPPVAAEPAPQPEVSPEVSPEASPGLAGEPIPAPWAEPLTEDPPAPADEASPPAPRRRGPQAQRLLLVVGIAAGIGLSHHFALPEAWMAGLLSQFAREGSTPDDEGEATAAAPIAAEGPAIARVDPPAVEDPAELPPTSEVPAAEARAATPPPARMEPWPEDEALRLDLFGPLAASVPAPPPPEDPPVPAPPPQDLRPSLPPAEEVVLLPPQPAAAQPAPEESPAAPRIAEALPPEPAERAGPPDPPAILSEPEIGPDATARIDPAEPLPPPASDPEMPAAMPIEAELARAPMPEPVMAAAPPPARPELPPAVIDMLVARGDEMLARGDISGARLLYARAAAAGSSAAARAMGRSFEAEVLNRLGVRGIRPDPEQARHWYRRAEEAR